MKKKPPRAAQDPLENRLRTGRLKSAALRLILYVCAQIYLYLTTEPNHL